MTDSERVDYFGSDKLVIITGAASGIGAALARAGHARGTRLLLSDIDAPALEALANELGADYLVCDVRMPEQVFALADKAVGPIGAVFANAGVMKLQPLVEATAEDWAFTLGVNVMGVANMVAAFVPRLQQQRDASRFVATASVAGLVSAPMSGTYNASKQAVVGICETLHHELSLSSSQVGVSVICPGAVQTDILKVERYGHSGMEEKMARSLARKMADSGMPASVLAEFTFEQVQAQKFWIIPQDYVFDRVRARFGAIIDGSDPMWMPKSKE